jgi:hypothetical protein
MLKTNLLHPEMVIATGEIRCFANILLTIGVVKY